MAPTTKGGLLERLSKDVVLSAEGYLFELEKRGYLKAGPFVPEVVLDNPEAIRQVHREFLQAGSEIVVAFTYYAHRDKLRVIGREHDLEALNLKALQLAKEVAAEGDALVAGNICNTWVYDHNDKERTGAIVRAMYDEQVGWAAKAGVDLIVAETIGYVGEAEIALEVIKKYNLPAVINFNALEDVSQEGIDWIEGCKILEAKGADVVGFNCGRGPETLIPLLKKLRAAVKIPIAALPVPYHTTPAQPAMQHLVDRNGKHAFKNMSLDQHLLSRYDLADFAKEAKEIGVNYLGLCCGAQANHIRAMAEALGRTTPSSKYSADFSKHGILGDDTVVKDHEKAFKVRWTAKN